MKEQNNDYRRTVLVVDDEAVNRQILGAILDTEYEVLYAENGHEALDQVNAHKETLSLILLDLLMPEMDGYKVIETLRSDDDFRKIPIIVLTSEKSAEVKSLQMGVADFLSKPYDLPEVILARVRHSIELFENETIIKATENDVLTGLYTKEFFFEYGHQIDLHHPEMAMDAVVINFNRFHLLNELYGRSFGDTVLCTIAAGVRLIAEEAGGIACRYDADSFYLYIPHHWNYDKLLDRIMSSLMEVLKAPEIRLRMGAYPDIYRSVTLEQRFDRALQACNSLRNQFTTSFAIYDMKMHEKEVYAARLLSDFDTALKKGQFKVLYQPKFNIKGKTPALCSTEALCSWQHPEFGRVRPDAFIPLFEKNGLIQKLDRYVWRKAAEQMSIWKKELDFVIPVSVNVSRVDIYDANMVQFLLDTVKEFNINPASYLLEITESAYTDNSKQIIEVVNRLRKEGFKVEMDDFGSGYSSLNMLTTLPIDALKMDMAFVHNIAAENKEMHMVELVIDIAKFLKVPVIAEGVESKDQYELLKKAGCDIIQGFYFSRPIAPEDLGTLIKKGIRV